MESAVPEAAALYGRPVLPDKCQRTVKGRAVLRPGREILPLPRYCGGLSVGEAPHFQDLWLRADKWAVWEGGTAVCSSHQGPEACWAGWEL